MKQIARMALALTLLLALVSMASAQSWTPLTNQPGAAVGPMLQLRDGRVLVNESQGPDTGQWFLLTPDSTGSYVNGTWSSGGHLQSGYQPIYFGSQVLLDGKTVVIAGGEYNMGHAVWTTMGARATVTPWGAVTWTANAPPAGWGTIGDAQSVILSDKKYMQGNCCTPQSAIYTGPNSWISTGNVLQPSNDESAFTLLTNNKVLTVDAKSGSACGPTGAELYTITNQTTGVGTWACTGSTPVILYNPTDEELGSAVMMYNNKLFQMGGNIVASAVYDVASGTWAAGPTPANGLDQADGPGVLEPNGKVLEMLSPGLFQAGCQMVEYNPTTGTLTNTANPTNCPGDSSFVGHFMDLPTGQILFTDFSGLVEIYTPAPGVVAAAVPTILAASTHLSAGSTNNVLYGKQLNGLSEAVAYGDDYQGATNYPLVRLTNTQTGAVTYAFSHDDSTHSIAPGTIMSTMFDVPASLANGTYKLNVVANGIASNTVTVSVP